MAIPKPALKLFLDSVDAALLPRLIPVFHGWIQRQALPGMLIDVADYRHVPEGPGVLIVANDGYYAIESTGGRWGMSYSVRRTTEETFDAEVRSAARRLVSACRMIDEDADVGAALRFPVDEVLLIANDRLLAPNDDSTYAWLDPAARSLGESLFAGQTLEVVRPEDPRERPSALVRGSAATTLESAAQALATD